MPLAAPPSDESSWTKDLGIATLLSAYRDGSLTPERLINDVYDRIEAYKDKAVWITLIPREKSTDYARQLQQEHRAGVLPPLFGVPFSVKDSFDVAGLPTTVACPSFAYTAERTSPVVQKLLDAGGILIGKTNMDQFATGMTGRRSPYGTPRCVYDADYITGGSSSGSAVTVAAGLVSFTLGTDTAGSIRVPAALNGVVGLKPTLGTVSAVGVVPACRTADCVGIITKSIDDAEFVWKIVSGYDEEDIYARQAVPQWPAWPSKVRFGTPSDRLLQDLSPEYSRLYSAVIEALPSVDCVRVEDFDYTSFNYANDLLYNSSIVAQRLVALQPYIKEHGLDELHPVTKSIFSASSDFDAVRTYQDIFDVRRCRRLAEIQFRDNIDILVVPSTVAHFTVAEIDEDPIGRNMFMGRFSHFVNLLDLCAVAVPVGTWTNEKGNEMPFGVTLIAPAGRDADIMRLGKKLMSRMLQ
ncbi:putative glutamyl-tRNA amidotransferase subunit A [Biscogniauxia marginata]|nr:putative glutamyl-tRNA amidotransferase subunit A [Biscogniauxia marginata]